VGKSTIINALVGEALLPTREVRARDGRGQHASTNRQLVVLPGGALVIDTPGMRELQLWDVADGLAGTFGDIAALGGGCRFRDCRHTGEPGCAVQAAVDEGRLAPGRLDNYRKLDEELAHLVEKQDGRARLERKRRDRVIHRAARRHKPRE
jgi:ribosome biogenesis GTPase